MTGELPVFRDRFLGRLVEVVGRRRVALREQGVGLRYGTGGASEWLVLTAEHTLRARTELQLVAGNVAHVVVCSAAPRTRGRELARLEFLRLVDNAARVLDTYERTLAVTFGHHADAALPHHLRVLWAPLQLRVVT